MFVCLLFFSDFLSLSIQTIPVEFQTSRWSPKDWQNDGDLRSAVLSAQPQHFLQSRYFRSITKWNSLSCFSSRWKLCVCVNWLIHLFFFSLSRSHIDTCYVLSFAVIILNTSLHNPSVKEKPTLDKFIAMNRGINDGKDLPRDILEVQSTIRGIPEFFSHYCLYIYAPTMY